MLEKEGLVALKNIFFEKELLLRIISSIILVFLALSFNFLGNYYFFLIVFIIYLILLNEFYRLFKLKVFSRNFIINSFINFICLLFVFHEFYLLLLCMLFFGILLSYVLENYKWKIIVLGYFYLSLPLLIFLHLNNNVLFGKTLILWTFVIVWSADISAYFFGRLFAGPKLLPSISPNKTWSGFASSIFVATISSIIFSIYYDFISLFKAILVGFIVSLFSNIGDLFESWIKRINFKKDSSNLIPGHGGLLDRLDGFLFAIVVIIFIT